MRLLSRKEELLLLSIWKLKNNAYGVPIREYVSRVSEKYWSIGAVYDVLDRLTRGGFVTAEAGEPTAERGGKSKRFYRVTKAGFAALEEIKTLNESMWSDLPRPAYE